jgi:RNA-directed DNA polymerase
MQPNNTSRFSVSTLDELAALLGTSRGKLQYVANNLVKFYRSKPIPKPDGGERVLWIPRGQLREVQDLIKRQILQRIQFPSFVHGGIRGKSAKTFARGLAGRDILLALDIKKCFPSVTVHRVRHVFHSLGFERDALNILVKLTTWEFQLPQGPPTSPHISNLALDRLDRRQAGLAKQHGFRYRRFVDDMGIAGGQRLRKFQRLHEKIVIEEGFALKDLKPGQARLMDRNECRQQTLNLVVNEKVNLPREHRRAIVREAAGVIKGGLPLSASQEGKLAWLRFINPNATKGVDRMRRRGKKP